ncbi:MAG: phosphate ABC transporter permease subunit PstC [Candidatus Peribacteraceae bacterium]|nr:phosphate ABC transporter permease subunit PstC [Candidatus Peribacteraceae bacterium]
MAVTRAYIMRKHSQHALRHADYLLFGLVAVFTVFLLLSIFLFLFLTGIQAFTEISVSQFFTTLRWDPTAMSGPKYGILSQLAGTLSISVLSLLIAVPAGLSIAICLSEMLSPRLREILKPTIEMIASIPSVVLGLVGLLYVAPLIARVFHISNGLNAVTASLLIAIAVLPTIASICEDALSCVPDRLRDASFALGATRWTTIKRVVIPTARSGILAGIMLGFGRAIGETMIVLMVAGNSLAFPKSLLDPVRPITANIAIEIKEVTLGSIHWDALFAVGCVLFLLTFIINFAADFVIHAKDPL